MNTCINCQKQMASGEWKSSVAYPGMKYFLCNMCDSKLKELAAKIKIKFDEIVKILEDYKGVIMSPNLNPFEGIEIPDKMPEKL